LQLFYRSADVAVFPYENILTSGSALLAMTFGVPPILPRVGMVEELLQDGQCGFTFESKDTRQLLQTLCVAFDAKTSGKLSQMGACALERASSLNWQGVDKFLSFPL
jgi:glycosyltransferase involved in cell wall biosynthesis